jgi:hypothetical protein
MLSLLSHYILLLATVFTACALLTGVISGTADDLLNETNYTVTATNTGTQTTILTDPANPADLTHPREMSPCLKFVALSPSHCWVTHRWLYGNRHFSTCD